MRSGEGGPGPNAWDRRNVWVDTDGYLHLKLAFRELGWTAAEVFMDQRLGFGTYRFKVLGDLDALDDNVVLGLFNYTVPDVGPDSTNEIDIEFATWGGLQPQHGNYTVWPAVSGKSQTSHAFDASANGSASTHAFTWTSTQVAYTSHTGLTGTSGDPYAQWTYAPSDYSDRIPQNPLPMHMNLWAFKGWSPKNGQEAEVVITEFSFTP